MTRKIIITNTDRPTSVPNGTIMTVVGEYRSYLEATIDGQGSYVWIMLEGTYEEYAPQPPASQGDTPTLWRDMTPEEKGALLLAHHEKVDIQAFDVGVAGDWAKTWKPLFFDDIAYRIKPEPKVEVVTMDVANYDQEWELYEHKGTHATHRITFNTIDGKPDPESIKMEEL